MEKEVLVLFGARSDGYGDPKHGFDAVASQSNGVQFGEYRNFLPLFNNN